METDHKLYEFRNTCPQCKRCFVCYGCVSCRRVGEHLETLIFQHQVAGYNRVLVDLVSDDECKFSEVECSHLGEGWCPAVRGGSLPPSGSGEKEEPVVIWEQ
jgi:hypothetical protein